jgi:hypothetical protein
LLEAEALKEDVVMRRGDALGFSHPEALKAMKSLAQTLESQGNKDRLVKFMAECM